MKDSNTKYSLHVRFIFRNNSLMLYFPKCLSIVDFNKICSKIDLSDKYSSPFVFSKEYEKITGSIPYISASGLDHLPYSYFEIDTVKNVYSYYHDNNIISTINKGKLNLHSQYEGKIISFIYNGGTKVGEKRFIKVDKEEDGYIKGFDLEMVDYQSGLDNSYRQYDKSKISGPITILNKE